MTDDEPVTDTSAQGTCTFTPDEVDISESLREGLGGRECSRPIWDETGSERCVWHAEHADKPPDNLAATVGDGDLIGVRARETDLSSVLFPKSSILVGADLTDADLEGVDLTNANLADATLTDANLKGVDLTNADLDLAKLTDADLDLAKLTDAYLRGADLTNANLEGADLSGTRLETADLSGANLSHADLSGADLREANLSGANLRAVDLTGAHLVGASLIDANLDLADLTDANLDLATLKDATLVGADLTNANLRATNLTDTDLREANLSGVVLNRGTQSGDFSELRETATAADDPDTEWDSMARTYHSLKTAFAANGLIDRARDYHFLERDAREQEIKAAEGWVSRTYFGSKASRYLTGYGVRPTRVGLFMAVLFSLATVAYLFDPGIENSLSYSVVTFTTSPPGGMLPTHPVAQGIALIETFVGTVLVVLLGYVLGNRERF